MAGSTDAKAGDAAVAGAVEATVKQPWQPPVWWGPLWATVYAVLLTPPLLIVAFSAAEYFGRLLQPEKWMGVYATPSEAITVLSLCCAGLLVLLRFSPNHPLPMLKKLGFVTGILFVLPFILFGVLSMMGLIPTVG